jgi:hypothetical protein
MRGADGKPERDRAGRRLDEVAAADPPSVVVVMKILRSRRSRSLRQAGRTRYDENAIRRASLPQSSKQTAAGLIATQW